MPETLAQKVRAKFPGAYDDLSDQELEAKVHAKFPGAYDDLPQTAAAPKEPEGSALGRVASGAWSMLNPIEMVKGIGSAVMHPEQTARAVVASHGEQFSKAADDFGKGRYTEALGHGAAAMIPLLGPAAAKVGERIADTGDVWTGVGEGIGLAGGVLLPGAAAKLPRLRVPAIAGQSSAKAAEAVAFGERAGIPIDAATATSNKFVQGVQHMSDRSLGGAFVADNAKAAQQQGLATVGEQLAAKAHPTAVGAEGSGTAVRDAVLGKVNKHAGEANAAYDELRAIEADPANLKTIHPEPVVPRPGAPSTFAIHENASVDALFEGAWKDAKAQGYKGSRTELRAEFADKVRQAKSLKAVTQDSAEEFGHDEFLKSVRDLGGLKPFEKDYRPGQPAGKLTGDYENLTQLFKGHKGASSIMRADGLELDDLLGQLKQDPRWDAMLGPDATTQDLKSLLEEIGTAKRDGTTVGPSGDLQHYLRAAGAEPGIPWWETPKGPVDIPLPVDLRAAKVALKPVFEDLKRQASLTPFVSGSGKARALDALDRLMTGGEHGHASLSTVDGALSELKAFARSGAAGDVPALATQGQGAVKLAIAHLEDAAQLAAADAGPEAVAALKAGRAATVAKYDAADVLDSLNAEPVKAHGKLTTPKDGAIEHLRAVAAQVPGEIPKIGRAVLDGLLDKATEEGGFGHTAKIAADWEKLGTETKRLLYKDPGYIADLDKFFRLAKMTAQNSNPSGTAHSLAVAHQGAAVTAAAVTMNPLPIVVDLIGTAGLSKLMHSQTGVRFLTKGLRIPVANTAATSAFTSELSALAAKLGATSPNESRGRTTVPALR